LAAVLFEPILAIQLFLVLHKLLVLRLCTLEVRCNNLSGRMLFSLQIEELLLENMLSVVLEREVRTWKGQG